MNSASKIILASIVLNFIFANITALAEPIPDNKRLLIDDIMKQTGTAKVIPLMTNQLVGEILTLLKKKDVPLDRNLVALVQSEAKTVMYEEFTLNNKFNEIFYGLYDEYFSIEELKEIATFYNSSAGKRALSVIPDISRRSMEQAKEHSKGIGSKVQQRLMKRFDEHEKQRAQAKTANDSN